MHDADTNRLYVAVGDPGAVVVIDTEQLAVAETVTTEPAAHTSGWDPVAKTLYVFCPQSGGATLDTDNTGA